MVNGLPRAGMDLRRRLQPPGPAAAQIAGIPADPSGLRRESGAQFATGFITSARTE